MKAWNITMSASVGHLPKEVRSDFGSTYVRFDVGPLAVYAEVCRAWIQGCILKRSQRVVSKTIWLKGKYRALMIPDTTTEQELPLG